jgi:dihydropteroate synthase
MIMAVINATPDSSMIVQRQTKGACNPYTATDCIKKLS